MAETSLNTYSVTSGNGANTTSNPVAVVNDGTANRQIVVLGKGDGTGGLVDGSTANPINTTVTNGTNVTDVVAGDTGFNGVATTSGSKTISFTTSSAGAQTLLANTNVQGYSYIEVVFTSIGTGLALTGGQFSMTSGGTYVTSSTFGNSGNTAPGGLTASTSSIFFSPIHGNFFQIAVSALTSGTVSGYIKLSAVSPPGLTVYAAETGTWTVGSNSATGSAVPANAFYMGGLLGSNLSGVTMVSGTSGQGASLAGFVTYSAPMLYNGATNDSARANWNTTTGDTGAKTASFAGATQTNYNHKYAYITVLCGTVSGTSPTMTAQLQWSPDAGTTWLAVGAASTAVTATGNTIAFVVGPSNFSTAGATPAALTTGATTSVFLNTPVPRTWRLNYVIGGTTPSFAITGVYVNYMGV